MSQVGGRLIDGLSSLLFVECPLYYNNTKSHTKFQFDDYELKLCPLHSTDFYCLPVMSFWAFVLFYLRLLRFRCI